MTLTQCRSCRMGLASFLVQTIRLSGYGKRQRDSQPVSHCGGTLIGSHRSHSHQMGIASFFVHRMGLYAAIEKSLRDHAEEDHSPSSPHGSCIPHLTAAISTPNTANDDFIFFSSNSTHALRDTTELFACTPHDDRRSTFALLRDDGRMMGLNHRLLFWVPPASRTPFYNLWTALVMPRGGVELDLSHMAHGTRWQHCYE